MKINNKIASFVVGFVFIFIVGIAIAQTPNPGHTATQIGEGTIGNTLTITNGKVGIGVTTPGNKLNVVGGDEVVLKVIKTPSGTEAVSVTGGYVDIYGGDYGIGTGDNNDLPFRTNKIEKMRLTKDGNLGIGTASPTEKLDVIGNIKGSGLCIGSDCRTSWPTSASTQWVTNGANIYYNDGNIGIGTTSPEARLHVNQGKILVYPNSNDILQATDGTQTALLKLFQGGVQLQSNSDLTLGANSQEKVRITSSGNVGIGTINPNYLLTLGGNNPTIALSGTESGAKTFTISEEGASLWIRDIGNAARLQIDSAGGFNFQSGNLITTGNVGIGTASPTEKLEISGNAKIQGNLQVSGTITGNVLKGSRRTTICINTNYQPFVDQSCTNGEVGDGNWQKTVTANCPAGTLLIGGIADSSKALTSTFDYINNKHICNFAGDRGDWGKCTVFCSN